MAHLCSETGHGRRESRSFKVVSGAENLGGPTFEHARPTHPGPPAPAGGRWQLRSRPGR